MLLGRDIDDVSIPGSVGKGVSLGTVDLMGYVGRVAEERAGFVAQEMLRW